MFRKRESHRNIFNLFLIFFFSLFDSFLFTLYVFIHLGVLIGYSLFSLLAIVFPPHTTRLFFLFSVFTPVHRKKLFFKISSMKVESFDWINALEPLTCTAFLSLIESFCCLINNFPISFESSSVFKLIFVASWFVNYIFLGVSGVFGGIERCGLRFWHNTFDIRVFCGVEKWKSCVYFDNYYFCCFFTHAPILVGKISQFTVTRTIQRTRKYSQL